MLFALLPLARFCLDLGHARQIDPTMVTAVLMLQEFGERLRQVHVSDVGPHGEHGSIGALAQLAFSRVASHIPNTCPLIIESMIEFADIAEEVAAVKQVFDRPATIREHFGDL